MSAKATGLVWDLPCPAKYNDIEFRPSHKFVLVAYADHADHNGKNIWPAIHTIHLKTGLDERTVQRITHDLQKIGLLIEDGKGPRGTNRWALPFSENADKLTPKGGGITPPVKVSGDKSDNSSGDIPSGDIPSGVTVTPELKELNKEELINISNDYFNVWETLKETIRVQFPKAKFNTWIVPTEAVSFENKTLVVMTKNDFARNWLEINLRDMAQVELGVYVKFVIPEPEEEE